MSLPSALSRLSGDEVGIIFERLCNAVEPGVAVAFSSASNELRKQTQALWQQLRAEHEAAAALCLKLGMRSCKKLREAKKIRICDDDGETTTAKESNSHNGDLSAADLGTLGTLGSGLPVLEKLALFNIAANPDGVQRLAEGLGAGALPAVTVLFLEEVHVGDAGHAGLGAAST